jgi:glycosyltransferase involved in cell wall biosynthesis
LILSSFHHQKHEQSRPDLHGRALHQVVDGVPFVWIPATGYKNDSIMRVFGFFEFFYRVWHADWAAQMPAPDLIVGSTPHPFAALAAERLSARYGVPFVLELRDIWPLVLIEVGGYSRFHPFVVLVDRTMRHLYKSAARIILFSRDSSDSLEEEGGDAKKVVWLPHGVDLTLSPVPKPAPDDQVFTVKYFGAHNQWNSLDPILDAAKYLLENGREDIVFRFVGDGVMKPSLQARVKDEGIRNAYFDDAVPKRQVAELFHDADAFILNNHVDIISKRWMSLNKLYSYLGAGRPVIFGSCMEVNPVQEADAGFVVDAGNHVQIAEAVVKLAGMSPEQLHAFGRRGRKHIEDHYSVKAIVDRFEEMALDLVKPNLSGVSASVPV